MVEPDANSTEGVTMNYADCPVMVDPSSMCNHDLVIATVWAHVVVVVMSRGACVCAACYVLICVVGMRISFGHEENDCAML